MNIERIRYLRENNEKTQKEMAEILHCSQVSYSYYELGRREIPLAMLVQLANYYNCSVDYLLNLTDEKKPYKRKTEKST